MSGRTLKELIEIYKQNGGIPSAFRELAKGLEGKSGQELIEFEKEELEKAKAKLNGIAIKGKTRQQRIKFEEKQLKKVKARLNGNIYEDPYGWAEASYIQGQLDLLDSLRLTTAEAEEILAQNSSKTIKLVKYIKNKEL